MDKPTPPEPDFRITVIFHDVKPGRYSATGEQTDKSKAAIEAYGEAMAAWGAAQEQAKLHAEIAGLPFEPNDWVVLHKEVHAQLVRAAGTPSDFPFSGSGLTTCDMHDDESY